MQRVSRALLESRIKVALYIALCMIAGRRSFIEFDGRTWSIIDD